MSKQTIAVCGLPGSFSEIAAEAYRAENGTDCELTYFANAREVLGALQAGADLGVVPVSNSVAGDVAEAEAIPQSAKRLKTVAIPVRHQLLARPGTAFESVRRVVSHEQALAQCGRFLDTELPDAERVPYADTAQAAKDLAERRLDATDAVLASQAAADRYRLEVLQPNVQDSSENRTEFLVFALRHPGGAADHHRAASN